MAGIKAGDINLEYYVEGEGPPLLMIMGFGGQAASWSEPFVSQLRPHFKLIRFSNRGTGMSDKPEGPTTIRQMAEDAAALLQALNIPRTHVFGVSMGGMVAQELALNHPEKVAGLVLGCTTPGGAGALTAAPETIAVLLPTPGLSREEQIRKAWPAICEPSFIESRRDFLEGMLMASLQNPTPLQTLVQQMGAVQGHDTRERLAKITSPTLVIHGEADLLVPPQNGRAIVERLPGAELRIIPGAAHMFFWEQPEESARAIVEFLSRVPAAA